MIRGNFKSRRVWVAGLVCAAFMQTAYAGRPCEATKPLTVATVEQALNLAVHTWKTLDESGAKVVVLARAGQDLSKYGLFYSHLGFAYRSDDAQGNHTWRIVHKLNQCGTATADIYRQGLGDFFLDDLWRYQAAWITPTPEVQDKLLALLQDDAKLLKLHVAAYNMLAYPWSTKYQQSNQWAIETLAMAVTAQTPTPAATREQAQAWMQFSGYQPTTLNIGAFTRLGARMFKANIAFDDHPNEKRFSDRIETVTVDSVFAWLPKAGLTAQPLETLR